MNTPIKRIDTSLPLPEYKTSGAVAFDLTSRVDIEIQAGSVSYVPLNVVIQVPKGFALQLIARSSLHKKGIILANAVGLIDQDYCGDTDELVAPLTILGQTSATVARGERIVQGIIIPIEQAEWEETSTMEARPRGGFGTTGT